MNDLSIVAHIKNDIEFVPQFWKHIHSYNPREIVILDTGSVDGTYELLMDQQRDERILYNVSQQPHYSGMVYTFNKVVNMATSSWVVKLDADELLSRRTQEILFWVIKNDEYNCVSLPTIHHFVTSGIYFNCIDSYPDYHQRIFKKSIFKANVASSSNNHGSLLWNDGIKVMTLGLDNPLYHYSFLRSPKKLLKRVIINYYIDVAKITSNSVMRNIERSINDDIKIFIEKNIPVTPAWQTEPILIPFNDLEDYYIKEFIKWGKRVDFEKPEDLVIDKISDWGKAEKILTEINLINESHHHSTTL